MIGSLGSPESSNAGIPNPTRYTNRITGTPRKTSTKTADRRRSGNRAATRLVRTSATTSPTIRTAASITQNILMSSQKAFATSGNESLNALHEKKVSRTSGHPGLVTASATSPPMTISEDAAAMAWPLRARRRFAASRSARRPTVASLAVTCEMLATPAAAETSVQDGRLRGLAHPAILDLAEFARRAQPIDRVRDASGQGRASVEQCAPLVAAGGRELPHDRRARNLCRGQIERGWQVDHDRVDLSL